MRKVVRTAAMIALMFATSSGMANDGKLSLETKKESKSLVFELDSQASETNINLFDSDDHVIYSERILNSSYAKKFDLTNLAEGRYFFTTEDSLKKVIYVIEVVRGDVKIIKREENVKPVFRQKDGIVYLNLLNLDKEKVNIQVFDSSNRLVFSEKRENEMIIEKALNFTNAYEDSYTVVVKDANNIYYENIVVE